MNMRFSTVLLFDLSTYFKQNFPLGEQHFVGFKKVCLAIPYMSRLGPRAVDLDNFKIVNDTYGHYVGDQLLKELAQRMRMCLREADTISRRGGDEFTILLNISNVESGEKIARDMLQQISTPLTVSGLAIEPSASIGISLYPTHSKKPDQLIAYADKAMYQAKLVGGNQIHLFDETDKNT